MEKLSNCLILDLGHGIDTKGKRALDDSLREFEFNYSIGAKVSFLLSIVNENLEEEDRINFFVTNISRFDISLDRRVHIEKKIYLNTKREGTKKLFLSIHANAFKKNIGTGISSHYYSSKNLPLAEVLLEFLKPCIDKYKLKNRGAKQDNFKVLRETYSPALLVEAPFMTNDYDLSLLKSESFRNDFSKGLVTFLVDYFLEGKAPDNLII